MSPSFAPSMVVSRGSLDVAVVVGIFLMLSWLPWFNGFLGPIWIAFCCLVFPSLAPYSLLAAASIQDAPGFPSGLSYPVYALLGFTLVSYCGLRMILVRRTAPVIASQLEVRHKQLIVIAIVVIVYGFLLTLIGHYLGTREIGARRPPFFVAMFMIAGVVSGYVAAKVVQRRSDGARALLTCVTLILLNAMIAMGAQLIWGYEAYRSPAGIQAMLTSSQFTQVSSLGYPRLAGTYLSPDTFGIFALLVIIVRLVLLERIRGKVNWLSLWLHVGLAAFFVLATMSKNVALLFIFAFGYLVVRRLQVRGLILIAGALLASFLLWVTQYIDFSHVIFNALRLPDTVHLNETYRYLILTTALAKLSFLDWITGTGLSYWPVVLQFATPGGEANPHSWLLNAPGEFGLFGILVYVFVGFNLYIAWKNSQGALRALILAVSTVIFVCGAFDVDMLFGQSPFNFVIWFVLALVAIWCIRFAGLRHTN